MKPEEALKELSYDDTAYGGKCTSEVRKVAVKALKNRFRWSQNILKLSGIFLVDITVSKENAQYAERKIYINRIIIVTSVDRDLTGKEVVLMIDILIAFALGTLFGAFCILLWAACVCGKRK